MHDPRPPYLEGHHPHHHCGLHNDNLPHIHNPNSHPDGLDCHHHHHDPACGCHDHLPPDLHCLDVIPRFRFHEKDGETRGFHRTNVAYRDIILSALKNYPKLDEPQVAKAMWAFCKDIILRDEYGCCGVPVSEIDGESTHNICFTDHCGHELSKIQFYRTSNEAGVRIGVGEYSFGIRSFNGSAPETWTMYPSNPDSAQIARCDWVLDKMEDLLKEFLQNADDIPTQGSNNVVKSGGVYDWVLGLINQEISERLAGDANLQNQINELKQRKNYDMHQYPESGHTTQVVSCDGIYKYGQDILKEAKEYCDEHHSGGGEGGGGFEDEEEIPSVLGGSSGSLYFYAKNPFYNSRDNDRYNYRPPYNENDEDQERDSGGAAGQFCKLKTGDIIPATQIYRQVYVYYYNNNERGFYSPSEDYGVVADYDRMNFWFIDPISTDPSVKYKVAAPGYVYSGNKDSWSKTPGSIEGYGYAININQPEHSTVLTYIKGCDLKLVRIS